MGYASFVYYKSVALHVYCKIQIFGGYRVLEILVVRKKSAKIKVRQYYKY